MTQADSLERAFKDASPDSSALRVSLDTTHQSGIPPVRERLSLRADSDAALQQLERALVEGARAEGSLSLLGRGLKHLLAGASAAQEANVVLVQELEALRGRMSRVYENESLLQQRVSALDNALEVAYREREAWLVQEDAFLAGLLDEHEQTLFEVERKHERQLAELDLAFDELRLQYEGAKVEVQRLTYERDAAVALLNEPLDSADPAPSPSAPLASSVRLPAPMQLVAPTTSQSSGSWLGRLKLEQVARPAMAPDDRDDERATERPFRP
jgi:hypothetical protein